jgi:hypothetical protein
MCGKCANRFMCHKGTMCNFGINSHECNMGIKRCKVTSSIFLADSQLQVCFCCAGIATLLVNHASTAMFRV